MGVGCVCVCAFQWVGDLRLLVNSHTERVKEPLFYCTIKHFHTVLYRFTVNHTLFLSYYLCCTDLTSYHIIFELAKNSFMQYEYSLIHIRSLDIIRYDVREIACCFSGGLLGY